MKQVFVVQHFHILPGDVEDVKLIGVYSSAMSAHSAVSRLRQQPGFNEHPDIVDPSTESDEQGFHVSEVTLDEDHWAEGYVTL
jgi:hypothetical protein